MPALTTFNLRNDEKGAAEIIEATLVFPLCLASLWLLVISSLYIFEGFGIYSTAQKVADMAAAEYRMPGRNYFISQDGYGSTADDYGSLERVNAAADEINPYRYLTGGYTDTLYYEELLNKKITAISLGTGDKKSRVHCTVTSEGVLLCRRITVTVEKQYPPTLLQRIFGAEELFDISVSATAYAGSPAVLKADTDYLYCLAEDIAKIRVGGVTLSERMSASLSSLKDALGKLE